MRTNLVIVMLLTPVLILSAGFLYYMGYTTGSDDTREYFKTNLGYFTTLDYYTIRESVLNTVLGEEESYEGWWDCSPFCQRKIFFNVIVYCPDAISYQNKTVGELINLGCRTEDVD